MSMTYNDDDDDDDGIWESGPVMGRPLAFSFSRRLFANLLS